MPYQEAVKAIEEHNNKPQATAEEIARAANPFSSYT
jgi:hypothetical protein